MQRRCESLQEFAKLKISDHRNSTTHYHGSDDDHHHDNTVPPRPTTPVGGEHHHHHHLAYRHKSWTIGLRKKKPSHHLHQIQTQEDSMFPWPKTAPPSPDSQSTTSSSSSRNKWPHLVHPKLHSSPPSTTTVPTNDNNDSSTSKQCFQPAGVTVDPPEPPPQLVAHPPLRRRSSCPSTAKFQELDSQPTSTKVLSIEDVLRRSQPGPSVLKKAKQPTLSQQQEHEQQQSTTAAVPARSLRLRRRVSQRKESKALAVWKQAVQQALTSVPPPRQSMDIPEEKKLKYSLTRKFILRELYTTEVTFWNQLYFAKVMFHDALMTAISRNSAFARKDDFDLFANLFDLLQFSAKLLQKLQYFAGLDQVDPPHLLLDDNDSGHTSSIDGDDNSYVGEDPSAPVGCVGDVCIGSTMCEMAHDMVVFLRCALDYKENKRLLKMSRHNKGYRRYREKLLERRETRQFTMNDYLIIPIQRVARYNLLLTDLVRHTNPQANDYNDIVKAQKIVDGLAVAMDYAQK
ncbi:Dbl homology domain-containing protein [Zychaea mexicana]|uniref:rho guanine nucleotide exchange factor n=1 Tax=Zychaea mexicana TaxID=64656 RepID=UPI0022FE58FE|nr:rho guanine nucleotide exchange factor [Zychaea mexicana]KAI9498445.1 Dbl homology domain-containing protein [Zychaea mexicana]